MSIKYNQKVHLAPMVHLTELQGSAVLLNINNESYYGLNQTAYRMYQLLIENDTVKEALEQITLEFDAPAFQIETDLFELIEELSEQGIIILK